MFFAKTHMFYKIVAGRLDFKPSTDDFEAKLPPEAIQKAFLQYPLAFSWFFKKRVLYCNHF